MPYLPMPPPIPYPESEGFWMGCRRQELLICRCGDCSRYCHPPLPVCPSCQSWNMGWDKVSGRGRVEGFTIVTRALFPGFPVPYNVVRVALEEQEGLLLLGNLVDCKPEEIAVGMPVQATFEEISPETTLYYFRKAATADPPEA